MYAAAPMIATIQQNPDKAHSLTGSMLASVVTNDELQIIQLNANIYAKRNALLASPTLYICAYK